MNITTKISILVILLLIIFIFVSMFPLNEYAVYQFSSHKNETMVAIPQISFENIGIDFNRTYSHKNESNTEELTRTKAYNQSVGWIFTNGEWIVENKKYAQKDKSTSWHISYLKDSLTNYQVTVKVQTFSDDKNNPPRATLLFNFIDVNNFYSLYADGGVPELSLWENIYGIWSKDQSVGFPFNSETSYSLKAMVDTNEIKLYLNNQLQMSVENVSTPPNSKIGLGSYGSVVHFSDISITNLTGSTSNLILSYNLRTTGLSNQTLTPYLIEKIPYPSGSLSYSIIFSFPSNNYTSNASYLSVNDSLPLSFPLDLIRPPDIIYFPTQDYNRTFAIRLIAKGWDEQKQEWVFKEFMLPEFTWEDVVEGRTITASENSTG